MPIFLDVNVPMYAAGTEHPLKDACIEIMTAVAEGQLLAVIDAEIIQEVLHRYGALDRWPLAISLADNLMEIVAWILPITVQDIQLTVELARQYGGSSVKARDLIHAAVMQNHEITTIISADAHFDQIEGLRRISPQQFVAGFG